MRRRAQSKSQSELPAEARSWEDDIVTFDSKTDPENPKNVRTFYVAA
jgi:hypothetical protein